MCNSFSVICYLSVPGKKGRDRKQNRISRNAVTGIRHGAVRGVNGNKPLCHGDMHMNSDRINLKNMLSVSVAVQTDKLHCKRHLTVNFLTCRNFCLINATNSESILMRNISF